MEITYKNLSLGVHNDEDRANEGFIAAAIGMDLHGVGGGTASSAKHGQKVYQPSQRMVAETEAAPANDITDLIEWIYPFNGKTYGLSNGSRFYESSTALGGTWTLKFATSASTGGGGLLPFGSNMYYGQNAVLGQFDGTNSNHNFKTFNSSTAGPRPMSVVAGRLAIGNQRNVATLDSDETTFNGTRLQLPVGYVIRSLETWNDFLAIAADFTPPSATNPVNSRLFLWDGTSASYADSVELPFTSAPLLIANNNILWVIGGDSAYNLLIYAYNGSTLQRAFFIADIVPHGVGSRTRFQGTVLFGTNGRTNSNNGGVWMIGGGDEGAPFALSMPFIQSPGSVTGTNCGGLYAEANDLLASFYDGTNYGIDLSSNAVFPNSGAYLQTLPIHNEAPTRKKMFYGIKPDLEKAGTTTGATLVVKYRVDLATSWTTARTINASDTDISPYISIGKSGRRIEYQFNFTTSASNNPLRMRSFTHFYDVCE